jgi:MATE family multidrug resistance protein
LLLPYKDRLILDFFAGKSLCSSASDAGAFLRICMWEDRSKLLNEMIPGKLHLSSLYKYSIPIVTVQLGISLMGTADAIMVGRLSATDLAAVALGHLYFMLMSSFGTGTLLALDTVISQAVGSGDERNVSLGIQRGLLITLPLSLITGILLLPAENLFSLLRQPAEAIPLASGYALASIAGILPLYVFLILRQSLQCLGLFLPIVLAVIVGNTANIFLNWIFVFGHLGFPEMGAIGAGWATAIGRWLMVLFILKSGWPSLKIHLNTLEMGLFSRTAMLKILRIGCPIGIQTTLEYGIFAVIGLIVGLFGTVAMASHQIAISLASSTFMIAVGIAQATTVLVGRAVGSGDRPLAEKSAGAGLLYVSVVMAVTGITFFFFPRFLAGLYTQDVAVISFAIKLIPSAGLCQIFDGLQAVASGILRGIGDTLIPMVINLVGFWLIGLPVSIYLGFWGEMDAVGLWLGMVVALGIVCVFLIARVDRRFLNNV